MAEKVEQASDPEWHLLKQMAKIERESQFEYQRQVPDDDNDKPPHSDNDEIEPPPGFELPEREMKEREASPLHQGPSTEPKHSEKQPGKHRSASKKPQMKLSATQRRNMRKRARRAAMKEESRECECCEGGCAEIPDLKGLKIQTRAGRKGTIIERDPSDQLLEVKIQFDDGEQPTCDWMPVAETFAVNDPDVYHFLTIVLGESLASVLTLAVGFPHVTLTSIFLNLYFCRV